jgi:hypothetical protein
VPIQKGMTKRKAEKFEDIRDERTETYPSLGIGWDAYWRQEEQSLAVLLTDSVAKSLAQIIAGYASDCVSSVLNCAGDNNYVMTERGTVSKGNRENPFAKVPSPFSTVQPVLMSGMYVLQREGRLLTCSIPATVNGFRVLDGRFGKPGTVSSSGFVVFNDEEITVQGVDRRFSYDSPRGERVVDAMLEAKKIFVLTDSGRVWTKYVDYNPRIFSKWELHAIGIAQIAFAEDSTSLFLSQSGTARHGAKHMFADTFSVFAHRQAKFVVKKDRRVLYAGGDDVFREI